MTINTTANKTIAQGNGTTTQFTFNFIIPALADIQVYYTDSNGNVTELTQNLYSVTNLNNPAGGYVSYPLIGSPIASGTTLTIVRIMPEVQETELANQGNFYPAVVEGQFDYLTMVDQQLQEQVGRAVTLGITSGDTAPTLANPVPNNYLAYNSDGTQIISVGGVPGGGGGNGDVVGPTSSTSGNFASFGNTSGTLLADSGENAASFDAAGTAAAAITALLGQGDPFMQYPLASTLGTMSTQNASSVAITGGSIAGAAVTGLPNPVNAGDAAPKSYVDGNTAAGGFTLTITPANAAVYEMALDGVTDDSAALQNVLLSMPQGTLKIISENNIYIDALVQLNSYQTLDMAECLGYRGPNFSIGTNGQLAETPNTSKPHLYANINSGDTAFDVVIFSANLTPAAGQQFILRGQRDVTGNVPAQGREVGFIASVVNTGMTTGGGIRWTITPAAPVQNSYQVRYTGDPYEIKTGNMDFSAFTVVTYSAFTSNVPAGAMSALVANASFFNVGDYVFVSDRQTVGSVTGVSDTNPINNEINRIAGVNTGTNTVYFESALFHSYSDSYNGGISTMVEVFGAKIVGFKTLPSPTAPADSAAKNYCFILRYSVNCDIVDCNNIYATISGVNYGQYGEAFRMQNCLNCQFTNIMFRGKPDVNIYPSAQGYGFVLNGSTNCRIFNSISYNARHGILIQDGSAGCEIGFGHIIGARISAIDTHGINAVKNHVHDIYINGGDLFTPDATQKAGIRLGNSSHILGDTDNLIENIYITGFAFNTISGGANQGYGIDFVVSSTGNIVRNVVIDGCDVGIHCKYNTTYPTAALGNANIAQNIIVRNAAQYVTYFDGGSSQIVGGLILDNVVSDGNAVHFFWQNLYSIILRNSSIINSINTSNQPSIQCTNSLLVKILGNDFDGANEGIYFKQSPGIQIIRNNLRNQLQSTVFKDDVTSGNNNGFVWQENLYTGIANPSKGTITSTGTVKDINFQNTNNQSGTTYTFAQIDESNLVIGNNSSSQAYTIPTHASVPWQSGASIDIYNAGSGTITIAGISGVTYAGSTVAPGARGRIQSTAIDAWI